MLLKILERPRRNRSSEALRSLVREHRLFPSDFVVPFFVKEGEGVKEQIFSMPGVYRFSLDRLIQELIPLHQQGICAVALFPVIDGKLKDEEGKEGWRENSLMVSAIRLLKKELPSLCLIADVALDPFTSHGHDGLLNDKGEVDNDRTVEALVRQALLYALAGADIVAPSDMMDGRVGVIRKGLDEKGFTQTAILSYAVKYASSLYSPFREALSSSPLLGDKKSYQMDPANRKEALREALLDEREGADLLMVKPATCYLDVIRLLQERCQLPVGAYHVSGEYAMVMAADAQGFLDAKEVFYEMLLSIKRAGADFIFSYAAPLLLSYL